MTWSAKAMHCSGSHDNGNSVTRSALHHHWQPCVGGAQYNTDNVPGGPQWRSVVKCMKYTVMGSHLSLEQKAKVNQILSIDYWQLYTVNCIGGKNAFYESACNTMGFVKLWMTLLDCTYLEFYFRDHFFPQIGLGRSVFMQGSMFLLARSVCLWPKILCNPDWMGNCSWKP